MAFFVSVFKCVGQLRQDNDWAPGQTMQVLNYWKGRDDSLLQNVYTSSEAHWTKLHNDVLHGAQSSVNII